ncbi:MAG: hypothetical protein ACM3U1_04510 [Chloroflexota bacterium]
MRIHDAEDPRISVLKDKLEAARRELLGLLAQRDYSMRVRRQEILTGYESYFGDIESELDQKCKISWALDKESEIIAAHVRSGSSLSRMEVEALRESLKTEAENWAGANLFSFDRDEIAKSGSSSFGKSVNNPDERAFPVCEVSREYELQQNYRALVKALHPDAGGETELFRNYWQLVQNAYKARDARSLRLYCENLLPPERKFANKRDEEISLQTQLSQAECDIRREREKLENLRYSKPFCFEGRLKDPTWRARHMRSLRDRLFFLDRQISIKRRHIGNMLEFWRNRIKAAC